LLQKIEKTALQQPPQTSNIWKQMNSNSLVLRSNCSSPIVLINHIFSLFRSVSRAKNNGGEVAAAASGSKRREKKREREVQKPNHTKPIKDPPLQP
jgi:hypothetical protein